MHLTLTPAYGRDYSSAKDAIKDWDFGKDFAINSPFIPGKYCSIRDSKYIIKDGFSAVRIRYNKQRYFVDITLQSDTITEPGASTATS